MIRFDHFGWRFAEAPGWALKDISLHVDCGEFVTVVGPSGSGKTTLAMAMCGLLVGRQAGDAEGEVFIDNLNVAETPLFQVAEKIGLVQQNPEAHFATLTVRDEIAFGMENRCVPRSDIRRRTHQAMDLLGVTHLGDRELGTLSGGEQQRVAVASIVAGEPDVLVLDEPTASLDAEASAHLFRLLAGLCGETGLTVVIIEHKLAHLLPHKPRLLCMKDGRITADIPSQEAESALMQEPSVRVERAPGSQSRCGATPDGESPLIDMANVTVKAGTKTILDRVTLQVKPGEVIGVLGPNGGGKTTLLHCLMGLVRTTDGDIRLSGLPVSATKTSQLARQVGLVFQNADHQLVTDGVIDEALFAARMFKCEDPATGERARRMLARAGLIERRDDHPFALSWGQKRRLNVISAVLHRPRLLLLDEPFAGQDWANATILLDLLTDVVCGHNGGRNPGACLVVTHDPRVVRHSCTRVLFLSGGRVRLDAPVATAFDQLREMGHGAYTGSRDAHASITSVKRA